MVQKKMKVEQILSRTFGVMRIAGGNEYFAPIFEKGTKIPAAKRIEIYPSHNIGHYLYLECAELAMANPYPYECGVKSFSLTILSGIYPPCRLKPPLFC